MAKQTLIWTALPNGYTPDNKSIRVSVLLSPRLNPETKPAELTSFPDFEIWPNTLAKSTFNITIGNTTVTIPGDQTAGQNRVDTYLYQKGADPEIWQALFPGTTFVRGFEYKDLSSNNVLSYSTLSINDLVHKLYGKLAATTNDDIPLVSEIIDDTDWKNVITAISTIDEEYSQKGLRDPEKQFKSFSRGRLEHEDNTTETLAQFQLFHTPPATPKDKQLERNDDKRIVTRWLEYQRANLPDRADIAQTIDFHQIVAAMNSYPTLLRRLGLVIDFILDPLQFARARDQLLSVRVILPSGSAIPTNSVSPTTHVLLSKSKFEAVSNPIQPKDDYKVVNGLLDLNPDQFDLIQFDVDSAGLKLINFARSLARLTSKEERVDPITKFEKKTGAPSLRNAGMMLVHRNRWSMLQNRFLTNKAKNIAAEEVINNVSMAKPPELWAEDIVRGFRIDIWDEHTGVWRSLCKRVAIYTIGEGITIEVKEEGIVRFAATKSADPTSNQNLVYLHEAILSWTGWSLTAPPPGRAIETDGSVNTTQMQSEAELPPGFNFKSSFSPLAGSLPRLRYGRKYWIRARVVDLAGNSLSLREDDFGNEYTKARARFYLRYDPIAAPVVTLVRPQGGDVKPPAEGESMERVAIRSFNDVFDDPTQTTQTADRFIIPPQSSVKEAEYHGKLDTPSKLDKSKYTLLAREKDTPLEDGLEIIKTTGVPPNEVIQYRYAVFEEGRELTYLPDPLANEVSARIFNHPNIRDNEIITIPLYPPKNGIEADSFKWPEAQPFKIYVFDNPYEKPRYSDTIHTLLVPLPKAIRAKVRLSMRLSESNLTKMGIWHWLTTREKEKLKPNALNGQHWMLTPWRTLELIHAVQRPLITPEISEITIGRKRGETNALPKFQATCSLKSTDHIDLRAEWHEPIDDPTREKSRKFQIRRSRGDLAFSVKITDPNYYAMRHLDHVYGGFAEHQISGPDLISVNKPPHDSIISKYHEFHDTRYRRIEYWIDATTSFQEYMPSEILKEEVTDADGTHTVTTDKNIKVTGPKAVTWIPSSAPPPAPNVLYIVPTFGWVRRKDEKGNRVSWRRGGGLRVYLDRPWNVSGYGEMLGVVLPPTSFKDDPNKMPLHNPYKKYVTQWGNDPIWLSPYISDVSPKRQDFPLSRTRADPTGKWLPKDASESEKDQPPGEFKVTGLLPPDIRLDIGSPKFTDLTQPDIPKHYISQQIEVAPHDVFYDDKRRLWYCDIEIKTSPSYYPFIRLALARYQPVSVDSAHISNIVLADIMPLAADRWLSVTQTTDQKTYHVAVYGPSYRDSSGHFEAKKPPPGDVAPITTSKSAKVAGTSVIKIWVERLDPTLGEDFGWELVPEIIVKPDIKLDKRTGDQKILKTETIRATELFEKRNFETIINEGLIDKIISSTLLWAGDIVLPEVPPPKKRYRLVIGEYEEYLVDDEYPYDKVSEMKDRRLIFVEHVEIQ